ncbi:putative Na(+)/H(+) antiporter [Triangularia setosa]|uniref:Na(+)/H(+) antiporter n=1 Tax=Triangularia setosa TaxID=2587417 RepID=A0AAN6W5D4_9PEZI|nr:putative Na(+)/H(+) antiporter [Podospora setosa]
MAAGGDADGVFLAYHEPDIINILTLISFFLLLALSDWLADKIFRAGLIGQIIIGLIYGAPLADILEVNWQETFLVLGYVGLLLIIFEGGLTIRLDLLRQNFLLSIAAALLGVLTPIALSFALLYAGFGHAPLEAFIVGTALCSTSLGTTFVVINSASKDTDYSQTRIGTVLISAAVLDDVCGLVLVSVIHQLRGIAEDGDASLGWIIGRPILASGLLALLTPLIAKFVAGPLFRRFLEKSLVKFKHISNILLMTVVMCAFLAISAFAGASMLFGAFLAGAFLSSLPSKERGPAAAQRDDGLEETRIVTFVGTFEHYLSDPQRFILQPLFFASIGFAIPFVELWTKEVIWKGVVFTILMVFSKLVVGLVIPVWDMISAVRSSKSAPPASDKISARKAAIASWAPATLLGTAMVARGEIGLLIIQIGLNETPFLTRKAFVIGVWAVVLNTIIGPVSVGVLLKKVGSRIASDKAWGIQSKPQEIDFESVILPEQSSQGPTRSGGGRK